MPIKNYTSQVPANQSINNIESQLVDHGARKIMRIYDDDGLITGICFELPESSTLIPYILEAKIKECEAILQSDAGPRTRPETRKKIPKQAERTAWKILSDFIDIQMARLELGQIEITEALLPYIYNASTNETMYAKMKEHGFNNLIEYRNGD